MSRGWGAPAQFPSAAHSDSLMVVGDTVHLVGEVHSEGNAIQALVADNTTEAAWVIGLPHGLEDLAHGMEEK